MHDEVAVYRQVCGRRTVLPPFRAWQGCLQGDFQKTRKLRGLFCIFQVLRLTFKNLQLESPSGPAPSVQDRWYLEAKELIHSMPHAWMQQEPKIRHCPELQAACKSRGPPASYRDDMGGPHLQSWVRFPHKALWKKAQPSTGAIRRQDAMPDAAQWVQPISKTFQAIRWLLLGLSTHTRRCPPESWDESQTQLGFKPGVGNGLDFAGALVIPVVKDGWWQSIISLDLRFMILTKRPDLIRPAYLEVIHHFSNSNIYIYIYIEIYV